MPAHFGGPEALEIGWPSGVRAGVHDLRVAGAILAPPGPTAGAVPPTTIVPHAIVLNAGRRERVCSSWIVLLVVEAVALVIEELEVLLLVAVENHPHRPRPGEHFRVLDRDGVVDVIGIGQRVALDDVQRVAVEVAGAIEPGPVVELDQVDDERVSFPMAARVAQPPLEGPDG